MTQKYMVSKLDYNMLLAIDGKHKSRVEFEETCRLRTLARFGVRVTTDEGGVKHVDWTTVIYGAGR